MLFNFALFLRLSWAALFKSAHTPARLTPKRLRVLFWWYLLIPFHNLTTQLCFGLDYLLFPAFRRQAVTAPIFIIGNFRSGSTLLQRLLARDRENLTAMQLWEIYVAPSLSQRHFWLALGRLDARWLDGRLTERLKRANDRLLGSIQMHSVSLWEPDEDEGVMGQTWDTAFYLFPFPFFDVLPAYWRFDTDIPARRQRKILRFYRGILQRHVWFHGGKRYIAKNPAFCTKVEALRREFPDAVFIYLARNPIDTVASKMTFFSYIWRIFGEPEETYPHRDFSLGLIAHWYRYPLSRLDAMPPEQRIILRYDDLISDLGGTVRQVYERLGLPIAPGFHEIIDDTVARQRDYESVNRYSLAEMGLTVADIVAQFADIFDRFGFDRNGAAYAQEEPAAPQLAMEAAP
ncbi:MAG: sulfotransferase [Chloroflexi bacterium]|nr:sulfotransferase [Chloroflexota bacterium]